jgi:hypothetical protein
VFAAVAARQRSGKVIGTTADPGVEASRHDWLSFEHAGDTWMFDLTFLLSDWHCIFGQGCKGVLEEDATDLGHGCCSHGAHFADKADRTRVRASIARLGDDQWQLRREARSGGGPIHRNDDGDWVTRTHDGACVLLNRPDFERGAGCALHVAALDAGERPMDWKPEVCWQLPLRLTHHVDEVQHSTHTLREWKRRDWGEGGAEFHWWCTEGPEAFSGATTVLESMRDEIIGLVGDEVHARLTAEVELRRSLGTPVAHPARR